ncbi:MAG: hypothetical protein ACT4OY_07610 [Alphaproteobacteria bacterium]
MTPRTLKSSLLTLVLLCAATPVMAQGAPQYSFSPVKTWISETMQTPGSPARFCTVRNEYNNGFVLQFASSANGLELLAVNFRQDVFEAGRSYDVTLTPASGSAANFKALAGKADQLKIALGGHRDFYNALKKAQAFDLKIEGNVFRFELGGFTEATHNLDQCVGAAPTPVASRMEPPKQASAPPAATASTEERMTARMSEDPFANHAASVKAPPAPEKTLTEKKVRTETPPSPMAASASSPAKSSPEDLVKPPVAQKPAEAAKSSETIKWNDTPETPTAPPPSVKPPAPEKIIATPAPQPVLPPVKEAAPVAPPIPRAPPVVENYKSPEMKITRTSEKMEADFTMLESEFQRGGEGPAPTEKPEPVVIPERLMQKEAFYERPPEVRTERVVEEKVVYRPDPEMSMKISELEQTVQRLKSENDMLDRDLKTNVRASTDERVSISSENWDLERATLRYTEAEREIKRLGQKIQQERAQCDVEKKDLEGMLFDPRVTNEQQMAKLADLENKLVQADQELSDQRMRYESRIKELEKR